MESMTEVTSEDLAGVYKDLAETVGVENAYKIYSHFKVLFEDVHNAANLFRV